MSFIDLAKKISNKTTTEKGNLAFKSTTEPCLDYFYMAGGKRNEIEDVFDLYIRAFLDNPVTAIKLLLFTRDIKGGLGERKIFRYLLSELGMHEPEITRKLIPYVVKYGRYDDLLCLLGTKVEDDVVALIKKQLDEDIENKKAGKNISLLAKWLPSINTSSDSARQYALYLCEKLGLSKADYRKTLSFLRKGIIIENNLREKDYSFKYESVPSVAMTNYHKAFERNDTERFNAYLESIQKGDTEMKIGVLDIVNFIKRAEKCLFKSEQKEYFEAAWKKLVEESPMESRTLVVRDGSGSMYFGGRDSETPPVLIANALTLLTSARLTGEFKNRFITFADDSELVDLSCKEGLLKKLAYLHTFNDCGTTNIQSVYELIINVYKDPGFKKEDAIEQIMIVSDMEFDALGGVKNPTQQISTFEYLRKEFANIGYKMPGLIFWNVKSRGKKVPVTSNEAGVKLISGSNKNVIDMVISTKSADPMDFMMKALEPYAFVDELLK